MRRPKRTAPRRAASGKNRAQTFHDVKAFEEASLAGEFYVSFNVNSTSYRQKSSGPQAWIAECRKLLTRLSRASSKPHPERVVDGVDTLFGLLRRIDQGEDFIFLADEPGSWQVHVEWLDVFPAYFAALAPVTEPVEYARRVVDVIEEFNDYDQPRHLAVARRVAMPGQRKALRGK